MKYCEPHGLEACEKCDAADTIDRLRRELSVARAEVSRIATDALLIEGESQENYAALLAVRDALVESLARDEIAQQMAARVRGALATRLGEEALS